VTLKSNVVSWVLVAILSIFVIYQYLGANKAEQKAQDAEDQAKVLDAKLKDFIAGSAQREAAAQARYEASMAESAQLRAILAKGSQAPRQNATQSRPEAPGATKDLSAALTAKQPENVAQTACQPFIYQGKNLTIASFPVLVCDQQPMVQAEAAVQLQETEAKLEKSNTDLAETTAKLVLEDKDLAQYKIAEQAWKKAAHKSRIKRAVGVAEKVGLFVAGVYLGHKF
jgi:hypothetical protein